MSQGPLCPNLSQKVQAEVSQMANRNLSRVILLGGLSVNLNHLKSRTFFKQALLFWGIFYQPMACRQIQKRLQKLRIGPLLKHQRRFIHSLGLLRITVDLSLTSLNGLGHFMP